MKNCSVCLEDFEEINAQFFNCMHCICVKCFEKFKEHGINSCPLCRKSISIFTQEIKHNNTPTEPSILENTSSSYIDRFVGYNINDIAEQFNYFEDFEEDSSDEESSSNYDSERDYGSEEENDEDN